MYYIFVSILLLTILCFTFFFCSVTEVQRDVEYRVTFNVGNSTVFLNMYETETNIALIRFFHSLIRMFIHWN